MIQLSRNVVFSLLFFGFALGDSTPLIAGGAIPECRIVVEMKTVATSPGNEESAIAAHFADWEKKQVISLYIGRERATYEQRPYSIALEFRGAVERIARERDNAVERGACRLPAALPVCRISADRANGRVWLGDYLVSDYPANGAPGALVPHLEGLRDALVAAGACHGGN